MSSSGSPGAGDAQQRVRRPARTRVVSGIVERMMLS